MTNDKLQEIKDRIDRTTSGPWWYDSYSTVFSGSGENTDIVCWVPQRERSADADFIAHAPSDIKALVTKVERLSNELDEIRWDQS